MTAYKDFGSLETSILPQSAARGFLPFRTGVPCQEVCLRLFRSAGSGREYLLQGSRPGFLGLAYGDLHISTGEPAVIGHLSDHRVAGRKLAHFPLCHFRHDLTEGRREQISRVHGVFDLNPHAVSKGHLADRRDHSVPVRHIGGQNPSCPDIFR